jgi:hypothetical protein
VPVKLTGLIENSNWRQNSRENNFEKFTPVPTVCALLHLTFFPNNSPFKEEEKRRRRKGDEEKTRKGEDEKRRRREKEKMRGEEERGEET